MAKMSAAPHFESAEEMVPSCSEPLINRETGGILAVLLVVQGGLLNRLTALEGASARLGGLALAVTKQQRSEVALSCLRSPNWPLLAHPS